MVGVAIALALVVYAIIPRSSENSAQDDIDRITSNDVDQITFMPSKIDFSAQDIAAVKAMTEKIAGNFCSSGCEIYPHTKYGSFYVFGLAVDTNLQGNGNSVVVRAQKTDDGSFVLLYASQEEAQCALVAKHNVPHQIESKCYDDSGHLIENSL